MSDPTNKPEYPEDDIENRPSTDVRNVPPLDAEDVRSNSRTAQDRKNSNRGGDEQVAPTKEFPS
jgi:hypothetical protein